MTFFPVKNEHVKNETRYDECDGLRCVCDILDLGKNKQKCLPMNKHQNMMNVVNKRGKLCDLESKWKAWLDGLAASFLTGEFKIICYFY